MSIRACARRRRRRRDPGGRAARRGRTRRGRGSGGDPAAPRAAQWALAAKDVDGAMAIVAVLVAGSGAILRSAAELRRTWAKSFADSAYVHYVRTPERIELGAADGIATAAEDGTWIGTFRDGAGERRVRGRYMVHWRKSAAGWRTVADVYVTLGCDGGC